MQASEQNRADELQALGWSADDVRRYVELWDYRQRWGAINLEREDRAFLRKAEAALPKLVSGRGSEKKRTQDKAYYRWLSFYREAIGAVPLQPGEEAAWAIVLEEELRCLNYYEPVLGLPDTLKAKELLPLREQWIQQASAGARSASFDFVEPLEALKQREKTSWKPLRGEGNSDTSFPVLSADQASAFREQVRTAITAAIRERFPSLKDSDKPAPPADWMPSQAA